MCLPVGDLAGRGDWWSIHIILVQFQYKSSCLTNQSVFSGRHFFHSGSCWVTFHVVQWCHPRWMQTLLMWLLVRSPSLACVVGVSVAFLLQAWLGGVNEMTVTWCGRTWGNSELPPCPLGFCGIILLAFFSTQSLVGVIYQEEVEFTRPGVRASPQSWDRHGEQGQHFVFSVDHF